MCKRGLRSISRFARPAGRLALLTALSAMASCAAARPWAYLIPMLHPGRGAVAGRVVDDVRHRPQAGVVVVATGPDGEQTEFTDSDGRYAITDLSPSSKITVRFLLGPALVERSAVAIPDGGLTIVDAVMPASPSSVPVRRGCGGPNVSVNRSDQETSITSELTSSVPVP